MDTPATPAQLNERFAIPDVLRFESGAGGLARAVISTDLCTGSVYLHGAHVAGYEPAGHEPVLFMSASSGFTAGKAIRGGVPVCFPWFGPHATDQSAPSHGPARTTEWQVHSTSVDQGAATIELVATFEPFEIHHRVTFGRELSMTLDVRNLSQSPATFEAALHTYLNVSDVTQIYIAGLEQTEYLDKVDGGQSHNQGDAPITFVGETDRVYIDTQSTCVLTDPAYGRRITIAKSGSDSTVVWNPWAEKAEALADLGDDDWPGMACIETANAGPNKVTLGTGETHSMNATISLAEI